MSRSKKRRRAIPDEIEELLSKLSPRHAAWIRNMTHAELVREEHKLTLKIAELDQERDELQVKINSNQIVIDVLEGRIVINDEQHRVGGGT